MTNQSHCLVFSGIAPHPPIMVPEVGRESIAGVRRSIAAMTELTERIIASGAESIILISPHAPLEADSFVAYEGPEVYGDFASFHAPETAVSAPVTTNSSAQSLTRPLRMVIAFRSWPIAISITARPCHSTFC